MIFSKRKFLKHLAGVFDLCVLVASFILATLAVLPSPKGLTLAGFMAVQITLGNCLLFALFLTACHELFIICGLYISKRLTNRWAEIFEVGKATLLVSVFLLLTAKVLHVHTVRGTFVLVFW